MALGYASKQRSEQTAGHDRTKLCKQHLLSGSYRLSREAPSLMLQNAGLDSMQHEIKQPDWKEPLHSLEQLTQQLWPAAVTADLLPASMADVLVRWQHE